ncbi:KAP P-loop domain-containing protein [Mycobacterium europaeum]|uniref:KAP P-loop domain-containing protein n=1 Tax=Mycobacterium europaeum TaxID=761804 RepID=A0A0U1DS44_9MYCO|nr:P-loop NTPase fold protein [Mycobacterium europaeum]CQD20031.1 KAP P-loop domain-containing protein [Mycobacterium europaeum]
MSETSTTTKANFPIYLDEPADIDLLSFDAVASAVSDALLDESLDPIALGLSGSWGSGKTSVLRLIAKQLKPEEGKPASTLVIETDPWRYDPAIGAKESLIGEILTELSGQIVEDEDVGGTAKKLVKRLAKRVDWGKALQVAAKSSITMTLPDVESVLGLIKPKPDDDDPEPISDMVEFRAEFSKLLESEGLAHIRNVVILVDDLDRCLPPTVVETLETIRLFLSVPKMSFVIAADETRIAEAIAAHFPKPDATSAEEETPSKLYLHKIVQTSVPVPALSDFDTEAYLVLLQVKSGMTREDYDSLVDEVSAARRSGNPLDDVKALSDGTYVDARATATRLKPIVHEKTKGNPRRIKRFLNDLSIRQNVASKRGITLDPTAIAKLMILETYFDDEFRTLAGWLSNNSLRDNVRELERQAGTPSEPGLGESASTPGAKDDEDAKPTAAPAAKPSKAVEETKPKFTDNFIRWARVLPSLSDKDIASYLVFAASFNSDVVISAGGLSARVKDVATRLLSSSISDNRSIKDEMIVALADEDAKALVKHIGAVVVDRPDRQTPGITAILRFARLRPDCVTPASTALKRVPPKELKPGAVLQVKPGDPQPVIEQMTKLVEANGGSELVGSLDVALERN